MNCCAQHGIATIAGSEVFSSSLPRFGLITVESDEARKSATVAIPGPSATLKGSLPFTYEGKQRENKGEFSRQFNFSFFETDLKISIVDNFGVKKRNLIITDFQEFVVVRQIEIGCI
jgi:hypothetical protein